MNTLPLITRLFVCLLIAGFSRMAWGAEDKVHTPEVGSVERKVIIDSVRAAYAAQDPAKPPVIFVVPYLKVHGIWAWIRVEPQTKDAKQRYEPQSGLFRHEGQRWVLVTWLPTEEGTDAAAFFKELKEKHPELPADILPKP
jgi:hypothetical protein